eukprot:4296004-Prymnesium_polylepis.1
MQGEIASLSGERDGLLADVERLTTEGARLKDELTRFAVARAGWGDCKPARLAIARLAIARLAIGVWRCALLSHATPTTIPIASNAHRCAIASSTHRCATARRTHRVCHTLSRTSAPPAATARGGARPREQGGARGRGAVGRARDSDRQGGDGRADDRAAQGVARAALARDGGHDAARGGRVGACGDEVWPLRCDHERAAFGLAPERGALLHPCG